MSEWVSIGKTNYLLTQPWTPIQTEAVTIPNAKKYISAASEGGFTVLAATSIASQKGDVFKSGTRKGEERPLKEIRHTWLSASAVTGSRTVAAFLVHFEETSFAEAKIWDFAGWPMILSDGDTWISPHPRWVTTMVDFEEWLGEMCPSFTPKKRPAPRANKQDPTSFEALTEMEYWQA